MHNDITKEDIEQSRHFPVIVVLCQPYTREVDYSKYIALAWIRMNYKDKS
jgi:hypothetical protein